METLLFTILTLCALGVLSAFILYVVARKFRVEEDPRIDEVEKMLPGANCGGCGFAGCRGLADALVKRDDISALYCPVGGAACMTSVAGYLGKTAPEKEAQVATVRCGGACDKRPRTNEYNGTKSCAVASALYVGETGCAFGCLGYGDCVVACAFDAIHVNPTTGLPEVDPDKCTACGACVTACPKNIIELRKKWPKNRAVYVSCVSRDKGAVVMKACKAGCIACGKCAKVCPFGAITIENNLAYIDPQKCKLCRKCVNECPTGAIRLENMELLPKEPKVAPGGVKAAAATGGPKTPPAPKASEAAAEPVRKEASSGGSAPSQAAAGACVKEASAARMKASAAMPGPPTGASETVAGERNDVSTGAAVSGSATSASGRVADSVPKQAEALPESE